MPLIESEDLGSNNMIKDDAMYYNSYDGGPPMAKRRRMEPENHVLLMTVLNPVYPVTVDVIHTISSPYGNVLRIVIFKKNGVQAMVEFASVEEAKRAKEALHGADIYSGCCTVRIEFAKPTKLNVYKNDQDSWDYTNPNLGMPSKQEHSEKRPLLEEPRFGSGPTPYINKRVPEPGQSMRGMHRPQPPQSPPYGQMGSDYDSYGPMPPNGPSSGYNNYGPEPFIENRRYPQRSDEYSNGMGRPQLNTMGYGGGILAHHGPPPNPTGVPQQGAVMMVYGLNADKMNCDRLFNLFCLYGNVVRIKFLKTKEGCAMVQLGDGVSVERSIQNLNNKSFFGAKLQLGYSKQAFLSDVQQPFTLPDSTPSFKDYMGNKNNRFINPEMAQKNRIQPPSKVLHFFNTPPGISDDELKKIFEDDEVTAPVGIKMFPSKTERSSSGLLEFESIEASKKEVSEKATYPKFAYLVTGDYATGDLVSKFKASLLTK